MTMTNESELRVLRIRETLLADHDGELTDMDVMRLAHYIRVRPFATDFTIATMMATQLMLNEAFA